MINKLGTDEEICKSGTDRMKIGYGWGMYKSGIDERNETDTDVEGK